MKEATAKNMFDELDDFMSPAKPAVKPALEAVPENYGPGVTVVQPQVVVPVGPVVKPVVDVMAALAKIKSIENELNTSFYEREDVVKVMMVALISKMSAFFIGEPGTGKTDLTSELCHRIVNGQYFSFLFNKTTDPSEVFGPFSLIAMERDQFKRKTAGFLPEAQIFYGDEIWKSNSPILNLLLPILNEREFVNDGKKTKVPLMTAFASSNEFPEDREALAAIYDRFVLRMKVSSIRDGRNVEKMLSDRVRRNNKQTMNNTRSTISIDEIDAIYEAAMNVTLSQSIIKMLIKVQDISQRKGGVFISDRKKNQCIDILQAYALYNGRGHVIADDLIILKYVFYDEGVTIEDIEQEILKLVDPYTDEINKHYRQYNEIRQKIENESDQTERLKLVIEMDKSLNTVVTNLSASIKKAQANGKDVQPFLDKRDEITNFRTEMIQQVLGTSKGTTASGPSVLNTINFNGGSTISADPSNWGTTITDSSMKPF